MKLKLCSSVPVSTARAKLLYLKNIFRYSVFILVLLHLCHSGVAQQLKGIPDKGSAIEVNYRDFPSREKIAPEVWSKLNQGKAYNKTQAYYKSFPGDSARYVAVTGRQSALESYYVKADDPSAYSIVKGLYAINFQKNGEWIAIDAQLNPMGNGVYEAPDQWDPVGINVMTKESYILTPSGKVQFNDWTLYGEDDNGKTVLAKANWNKYTIGADGMRIIDIFPGIDAELQVSRGGVKTNFIVHRLNYTKYKKLYFEDSFKGLNEKGLYFKDGENAITKAEAVYANGSSASSGIRISPAVGYPASNLSNITTFLYFLSGDKLSIEVPVQYLADHLLSGDVVIDPLVQSTNSIAQSLIGSMYNASCGWANSCDYTIPVTPPANTTITSVAIEIYALATAPCGRENFGYHVSAGTCASPYAGGVWIVGGGATGPGTIFGFRNRPDLMPCMPAPSCTPTPIDINFRLFRTCVGPTGCDNTCVGLTRPLTVIIQGRTAELGAITIPPGALTCVGQDITFSTSANFGVPPYSAINWSSSSTGTPSLGTGNSVTTGAALAPGPHVIYANTTDACGVSAQTSAIFTINPLPVATMSTTGRTICNGATTNLTPTSTITGTTYDWTVLQTGVTGASDGSGTSIVQTLNNYGTASGTAVYTITPIANGCRGSAITYTVTVDPVSKVLYVDDLNGYDGNCGDSWTSALKTVSKALKLSDLSTHVDSILVAAGTYYPTGLQTATDRDSSFMILRGKLKMYGGYPNGGGIRDIANNPTILSGDIGVLNDSLDNSYHVMVITGNIPATADSIVVDGFTLTKGDANGAGYYNYGPSPIYQGHGGGLYIRDNATGRKTVLRNLTIEENTARILGGGIEMALAGTYLQNCVFKNNHALQGGGGLAVETRSTPYITGCSFTGNAAGIVGGGVFNQNNDSQPEYTNCSFINNTAGTPVSNGWGGGMYNRIGVNVSLTRCSFIGNRVTSGGGGLMNEQSAITSLFSCVFADNRSQNAAGTIGTGGGVQVGTTGSIQLTNCIIANNIGGGANDDGGGGIMVYSGGTVTCINTTLSGNTTLSTTKPNANGISIMAGTTLNFRNSIVWGSQAQHYSSLGAFNYNYSLVKGTAAPLPNLDLDPLFIDVNNPAGPDGIWRTADDGLRLSPCSPAVNMGNNALVTGGVVADIINNARITGSAVDMGAYELQVITPTITFTDVVKTYGDPDAAVPNVTNCSGLPMTFTIADNSIATIVSGNLHIVKAGVTTITAHTINGTPDVTVNLTINPKRVTVSLTSTPIVKVYDGNTNATVTAANLQLAAGNVVGADDVAIALSSNTGSYDTKDVGTGKTVAVPLANISLTGTTASNYVITNTADVNAAIGIITQLRITITIGSQTKVYGDPEPALTYTFTPALAAGDVFTGSLIRLPGEDVGVYPMGSGTLNLSSNYIITFIFRGGFIITPRAITVTAEPKTKVYGDADAALTYTASSALVGSDAFTGSLTRTAGENIGVYPINQGTLALSSNYTITYIGNSLTITPKAITVTAEPKTKVYGDADPALTYTYSPALITGDSFAGGLTRTAGENLGIYPINQGTLALSSNYTITYVGNSLTITLKTITVTAEPKTKVYGGADPALTYTYSPALIIGDAFTGSLTRTTGEDVGVYPINQGTLALSSNYTITYMGNSLTITPKTIVVTADIKTKVYGDADPLLTYTYLPALVAGDAFTGSLTRAAGENVGVYPINQGTLALSSNYTITYMGNSLTITPKTIVVTADIKTKVYGDADPALTYTYLPALVAGDAFTGSLTRTAGENVGVYPINQGTLALSGNYTITYNSNSLTITPKAIAVTAVPKTKVYGDADPALTYTYSPALITGDAFTGLLTRAAGENVGAYPINQGTLALSGNYIITYTTSSLTITPKAITVTATAKTKVYGDADPAWTYTYSPALIGSDVFTGILNRTGGENVGSYSINQNTLALSSNYQLGYVSANLVITKAELTATADDATVCLGVALSTATISYSGFKYADDVSSINIQPTVIIPSYNTAGSYTLMPSGGAADNYSFNYVGGQLTVLPRPSGSITQTLVGPGVINTPGVTGGEQLTAPPGTGYTYLWSTNEITPSIFVRSSGSYSVKVTNQLGCSTTFTVLVKQRTIIIPNIFSPNGDGINDKWVIENLENHPGNVVQIYNRYGQAVHKMVNYTPWDGKINGKEMPIGTYYYIIDPKNGQKPITGYIDIIR